MNTAATPSGKQREPLLRIAAPARTFLFTASTAPTVRARPTLMNITLHAGAAPNRLVAGDGVSLNFSVNDTGTPPVAPWDNPNNGDYAVGCQPRADRDLVLRQRGGGCQLGVHRDRPDHDDALPRTSS